jgi:hypothetical protein
MTPGREALSGLRSSDEHVIHVVCVLHRRVIGMLSMSLLESVFNTCSQTLDQIVVAGM